MIERSMYATWDLSYAAIAGKAQLPGRGLQQLDIHYIQPARSLDMAPHAKRRAPSSTVDTTQGRDERSLG